MHSQTAVLWAIHCELTVGYDTSNATTYGPGIAANAETGKLTLASTQGAIVGSMPAGFNVFATAGYPNAGVVLNASGSETSNASLGGRPFGFVGRAATLNSVSPGTISCFAFTLQNNMTSAGESQYVVLSNAGANSYSDAWKYGTSLSESSYALNVVTESLQTVGTTGKSLNDALISKAAPKYNWVLWGTVSERTANGFVLNDGSSVSVSVSAPGNTVANGNYVSVRGTLSTSTNPPTLTSQKINVY